MSLTKDEQTTLQQDLTNLIGKNTDQIDLLYFKQKYGLRVRVVMLGGLQTADIDMRRITVICDKSREIKSARLG